MLDDYETELIKEILFETQRLVGPFEQRKKCSHEKLLPIYESIVRVNKLAQTLLDIPKKKSGPNDPLVF